MSGILNRIFRFLVKYPRKIVMERKKSEADYWRGRGEVSDKRRAEIAAERKKWEERKLNTASTDDILVKHSKQTGKQMSTMGICPFCKEYKELQIYEIPKSFKICKTCDIAREYHRDGFYDE